MNQNLSEEFRLAEAGAHHHFIVMFTDCIKKDINVLPTMLNAARMLTQFIPRNEQERGRINGIKNAVNDLKKALDEIKNEKNNEH